MTFKFTSNGVKINTKACPKIGNMLIFYAYFSGIKIPDFVKPAISVAGPKIGNEFSWFRTSEEKSRNKTYYLIAKPEKKLKNLLGFDFSETDRIKSLTS